MVILHSPMSIILKSRCSFFSNNIYTLLLFINLNPTMSFLHNTYRKTRLFMFHHFEKFLKVNLIFSYNISKHKVVLLYITVLQSLKLQEFLYYVYRGSAESHFNITQ